MADITVPAEDVQSAEDYQQEYNRLAKEYLLAWREWAFDERNPLKRWLLWRKGKKLEKELEALIESRLPEVTSLEVTIVQQVLAGTASWQYEGKVFKAGKVTKGGE